MTTKILRGDCLAVLPTLPDNSVHCVVTSPPYYGLRSYLPDAHPDKHLEIGLEPTPDEYVAKMVAVFREVRRALRDDGTLWLNIGDSYKPVNRGENAKPRAEGPVSSVQAPHLHSDLPTNRKQQQALRAAGIKEKDLLGIPWMLAFALRADGWYLRRDIIWHKPNPMPESVEDRPSTAHEHVFLLSKRATYFYDAVAISEPGVIPAGTKGAKGSAERAAQPGVNSRPPEYKVYDGTRNARSVWTIATQPYSGAHFATMAPTLAERCILAGTSERGACPNCGAPWRRMVEKSRTFEANTVRTGNEPKGKQGAVQGGGETGDIRRGPVVTTTTTGWQPTCACPAHNPVPCVVLDPFGGAGTTGLVADRLQRDSVLIELNSETVDLAGGRVCDDAPLLAQVT